MTWTHLVAYFLGGAFLANAVPHFVSGCLGKAFQTPFATPHGVGLSSSTVNVCWGFFNAMIGYVLVCRVGDFALRSTAHVLACGGGVLLLGLFHARHFGRFHGGNEPERS